MDEQLELHTERLALKVLDESFAERLLQYQLRNRAAWREWNPISPTSSTRWPRSTSACPPIVA